MFLRIFSAVLLVVTTLTAICWYTGFDFESINDSGNRQVHKTTYEAIMVVECTSHYEIPRGQVVNVIGNCTIAGDIVLIANDGEFPLYDDSVAATGLVTECPNGCMVQAEFGASIDQSYSNDKGAELLQTGCGNATYGCVAVRIISFDQELPEAVAQSRWITD